MTDNNNFSMRRIKEFVKKIKVADNSILLIKSNTPIENINMWRDALSSLNLKNVLIVRVDDLEDVNLWDKAVMQKHGWYRLEDIQKLFVRGKKDDK